MTADKRRITGRFGRWVGSRITEKPVTCTDACGPGWDRTSDLPRVKLRRSQNRDVCAGQIGRAGPILRVQSTQSKPRSGCGADEVEPLTGLSTASVRSRWSIRGCLSQSEPVEHLPQLLLHPHRRLSGTRPPRRLPQSRRRLLPTSSPRGASPPPRPPDRRTRLPRHHRTHRLGA